MKKKDKPIVYNDNIIYTHIFESMLSYLIKNNKNYSENYEELDVILDNIDISVLLKSNFFDKLSYSELINQSKRITLIISLLINDNDYYNYRKDKFMGLLQHLFFALSSDFEKGIPIDKKNKIKEFVMAVIQRCIINTMNNHNFNFLDLLLEHFNAEMFWGLCDNFVEVLLFNLNLWIKYIICFEPSLSEEFKQQTKLWYTKNEIMVNHTRVLNLNEFIKNKSRYKHIQKPFSLLEDIINYFKMFNWEFFVNYEFKQVIIDPEFIINNFVIYLIKNDYMITDQEQSGINDLNNELNNMLYFYTTKIFTNNNEINEKYFSKYKSCVDEFDVSLYTGSFIFEILKKFKIKNDAQKTKENIAEAAKIPNKEYCKPIRDSVEKQIKNEFGWKDIGTNYKEEHTFNILIEKDIVTMNHQEVIAYRISSSIINNIKKLTDEVFTVLNIFELNQDFSKLETAKIDSITSYCKWVLINDPNIVTNKKLKMYINSLKEIGYPNTIKNTSLLNCEKFHFNIVFNEFTPTELTEKEITNEISKYKTVNNKYLYNNVVFEKEQMEKNIKNNYFTLKITYRIIVECDKNSCFVITK